MDGPTLDTLVVVAYGLPAPQGSKKHVGRGVMVESSKQLPVWREDVKHAALTALRDNPMWDRTFSTITAHMVFTFPRPRVHYRTGKWSHLLRDGAPVLHTKKPDLDKLIRSTGDALTAAGVFVDDSRLARVDATKVFTPLVPGWSPTGALDRPGVRIVLSGGAR
jgi:Holliday junction resolvase RusA-like endonuclease